MPSFDVAWPILLLSPFAAYAQCSADIQRG
jgi:hypothetical protein